MSLGETGTPGAVQGVAVAVVRGNSQVVIASDETVMSRAVALEVVAATSPESIAPSAVIGIREALLDAERVSLELRLTPIFRD